ncbi:MAG TPA: M1 family aminopeptidase, partial [Candidatus Thermoplasmatota archaeon]|nr:M1 family aminopeptidase [Candidatus Thermoplasmatota archaeon]
DADAEVIALTLEREAPSGAATLEIEYDGTISRSMEGLYLSKDGAEECLATQCEETDARAIFPCFDEPAFKARFALAVTTTPDVMVLGNGPLVATEEKGGLRTWRFAPTKPMSTYLFATAIGRFGSTDERVVRGIPLRVYAVQGKEKLGEYGLDLAARLLPWFEDYFGARYHFDKYDQIAVPSFSAGAMENSGLVIFRQSLLLRDPDTTSWQQEKYIARVIAHEFAHQWFGNLVTMAWWDDIWLNESFAEWMAHKAADAIAPEYRLWDDFHQNKLEALVTDALETTHAIYTPVETPEQATELFDAVTYSKGSVLMRMIERFLGEDAFREGLRTYMKEFAERNAKGDDLWRHLEQASRQPVEALSRSWILQPGYPVVSARLDGSTLHLAQRRFFGKPEAPRNDQTWAVPLVVRYADDAGVHETRHLLEAPEGSLVLPLSGALRWAHLNADGVGFYRQELSADLRARLVAHVGELTAPEQRDLLDDGWALVRAGRAPITSFLDLLGPVLAHARDHHVLAHAAQSLEEVEELLLDMRDEDALARFRAWVRRLLAAEARRLTYAPRAGEPRDDTERRAVVLVAMGRFGRDAEALRAAVELAEREARDPRAVDPTLAGPAVHLAARVGDADRHARHVAIYEQRRGSGAPPQLAQRYLYSLGFFEDPKLLARTLALMGEGRFPLEALGPMLRLMFNERHARVPAWAYMKEHWRDVRERLGDMWTGFLVEHSGNVPAELRADLVRFYDANLKGVAQQSYARALEAMDARAAFEKRVGPDLVAWMKRPEA